MGNSETPVVMEDLVHAINKVQDVFSMLKMSNSIQLPQIVMLGSQSSGKSSVLESIVHRPFLPRGSGIVTRCPLVLQLIECKLDDIRFRNEENETMECEEWGEFSHLKGIIFTDFNDIRDEIERQTDELAGKNKGICETSINLKIYSPHVVTLTLVDLPGITKVAVGDQPEDIEMQIKKLVMKYISNPNSIILSVSTANTDIATSESLKYAKKVDPDGLRTLAILTKIDLMDHGTDAWEMLNGNVIPVKLGIIGIVNRSQKDINDSKTIDDQLKSEKAFFEKYYKEIAHRNGVPYLAKKLSELLMHHISDCLPKLKANISKKLNEYNKIYSGCGDEVIDRKSVMCNIIADVRLDFYAIVSGTLMRKPEDEKLLIGGPKFRKIFDDEFSNEIMKINPQRGKAEIIKFLEVNGGSRPLIFGSDPIFQNLVNEQIERLREPSIECVVKSNLEMDTIIMKVIDKPALSRFPMLKKKIREILKNILDSCFEQTKLMVDQLIEVELTAVNSNHPDFSIEDGLKDVDKKINKSAAFKDRNTEAMATMMEFLIKNYFFVVKKNIQDQVPKIIMYKLIEFMKKNIEKELLRHIFSQNEELLVESKEILHKRKNALDMIAALKLTKDAIEQISFKYV